MSQITVICHKMGIECGDLSVGQLRLRIMNGLRRGLGYPIPRLSGDIKHAVKYCNLRAFSVHNLRAMCRVIRKSSAGSKMELIRRIRQHYRSDLETVVLMNQFDEDDAASTSASSDSSSSSSDEEEEEEALAAAAPGTTAGTPVPGTTAGTEDEVPAVPADGTLPTPDNIRRRIPNPVHEHLNPTRVAYIRDYIKGLCMQGALHRYSEDALIEMSEYVPCPAGTSMRREIAFRIHHELRVPFDRSRYLTNEEAAARGDVPPDFDQVSLRMRSAPFIEMLERCDKAGVDIVWGV